MSGSVLGFRYLEVSKNEQSLDKEYIKNKQINKKILDK